MKVLLNLTKVRNVKVCGLDYSFPNNTVQLTVNYYSDEPCLKHTKSLVDLCDGSRDYEKKKVEKAYNDIKQALLKGEKYVEVVL